MDHALRTISYIADIGDLLVVMARRGPVAASPGGASTPTSSASAGHTKICCHVFESDEVSGIERAADRFCSVGAATFREDPKAGKVWEFGDSQKRNCGQSCGICLAGRNVHYSADNYRCWCA